MKRATIITALLTGLTAAVAVAQVDFADVPHTHPHREAIIHATSEGWFTGYEDGTFRPDQTIVAGQMTKVFQRAYPEGVSRAEFASLLLRGRDGAASVPVVGVRNQGGNRFVTPPHLPHRYDPACSDGEWRMANIIPEEWGEAYGACVDGLDDWRVTVDYWPAGYERRDSVIIRWESDTGGGLKLVCGGPITSRLTQIFPDAPGFRVVGLYENDGGQVGKRMPFAVDRMEVTWRN